MEKREASGREGEKVSSARVNLMRRREERGGGRGRREKEEEGGGWSYNYLPLGTR